MSVQGNNKIVRIDMIVIMGEPYLTDKEASDRYGYSQSWFIRARGQGFGPKWVQIKKHGRVLYPAYETDKWFEERLKHDE